MRLFDLFLNTLFQLCLFFVHNSANGQISILWKRISFAWKPNEKKIVVQFIMDGIKELVFLLFLLPQKSWIWWISERWSTLPLVFSRFFSQIPIRLSLWGPSKYKQTKSGAKDKIFRDFFSTTLTFSTLLSISQSQSWNFKDFVSKANFLECLILNSTWPTLQQKHL